MVHSSRWTGSGANVIVPHGGPGLGSGLADPRVAQGLVMGLELNVFGNFPGTAEVAGVAGG